MFYNMLGLLLGVTLFCASCNEKPDLCQYGPMVPVNMRIAEISPNEDGKLNVLLEFNRTSLGEKQQNLAELRAKATVNEVIIDSSYVERNGLYVGFTLTGTASELQTGNCERFVVSFDQNLK